MKFNSFCLEIKMFLSVSNCFIKYSITNLCKVLEQFLNSKTSTKRGIKQTRKTTIKNLAKSLGTEEEDLTDEEAETLYEMLSDDYVTDILKYIPASDFWALIEDAKESGDSQDSFISRISDYIEFGNDVDMRNKLIMIYEKYVK